MTPTSLMSVKITLAEIAWRKMKYKALLTNTVAESSLYFIFLWAITATVMSTEVSQVGVTLFLSF